MKTITSLDKKNSQRRETISFSNSKNSGLFKQRFTMSTNVDTVNTKTFSEVPESRPCILSFMLSSNY